MIISIFAVIVFGFAAAHLLLPDAELSFSERRRLASMPKLTAEDLFSGDFSDELEDYLLDQFPLREGLRTANSALRLFGLMQKDVDGLWMSGSGIFKTEYPLKEAQVTYGADIINNVCSEYLAGLNVYYSIIPDKNYFAAQKNGYPSIDYEKLVSIMNSRVTGAQYIDIFGTLTLQDYYRTDPHWSQPGLFDTCRRLAAAFGMEEYLTGIDEYTSQELSPFRGAYLAQSALPAEPDILTYLTSRYTDNAVVTGLDDSAADTVYAPEKISGMDGYDVFLSGAQSILTIECTDAKTDRELIIFRDSFGSSIAPLFLGAYSKITLVDLRYIPSAILGEYIEFSDQDVLFLYSTLLLNSSMLMK
ncbi:MAG: DHHW family protein [Oscillospiraceae bacterium]